MRFIFNFFLFGFLFYLIYVYFPDAFHTLVSWANAAFDFLKTWITELIHKFNATKAPETPEAPKALLLFLTSRFFR